MLYLNAALAALLLVTTFRHVTKRGWHGFAVPSSPSPSSPRGP